MALSRIYASKLACAANKVSWTLRHHHHHPSTLRPYSGGIRPAKNGAIEKLLWKCVPKQSWQCVRFFLGTRFQDPTRELGQRKWTSPWNLSDCFCPRSHIRYGCVCRVLMCVRVAVIFWTCWTRHRLGWVQNGKVFWQRKKLLPRNEKSATLHNMWPKGERAFLLAQVKMWWYGSVKTCPRGLVWLFLTLSECQTSPASNPSRREIRGERKKILHPCYESLLARLSRRLSVENVDLIIK